MNPHNIVTRRYPWGIQRLVSTHQFPHNPRAIQTCIFWVVVGVGGGGCWSRPTQPKVPRSVQICIFGGGVMVQTNIPKILEYLVSQIVSHTLLVWRLPTQPKVPRSVQICIFGGGGGGEGGVMVQTNIPKILEWGTQGILSTNFAMPSSGSPCIADSLSHTTCAETTHLTKENQGSNNFDCYSCKQLMSLPIWDPKSTNKILHVLQCGIRHPLVINYK